MIGNEAYAFDRVVAPISVAQFLAEYFEQKPLLLDRGEPDYYDDLVSVEALDEFLTSGRPLLRQVYLVDARREIAPEEYTLADQRIDVVRVYQLFAEGATITFRQMHDHLPSLARLCRAAELVFSCPFQTNLYLTPASAQGFKTHHDTHDVFVLQVSGSKQWRSYKPQIVLPLEGQEYKQPDGGPGPPTAEFILRAGDLWYCPRGIPHDANSTNEPSLHITFGALVRTWAEVMIEAMADLSLVDPMFRRSLPPGYIADGILSSSLEHTFRELAGRFFQMGRLGPVLEGIAEDFVTTRPAYVPGQREQTLAIESLTLDSRLQARPDLIYRCRHDERTVRLHYRNIEICFPRWVFPALRYALEHAEYRVRDLPADLDDAGKLVLVRRLIREGLVRSLPESGANVA
jgi:Cupin superfamily protein